MTKSKQKATKKRSVTCILPVELIERLDEFAASNYETRTAAIIRLIVNESKRREMEKGIGRQENRP